MLSEALRKKVYGPRAAESWPRGSRTRFRSVACGPVGWPTSVGPPGIEKVGPRIRPPCDCGFAIWPLRDSGSGTCGSGSYCGGKAGWSTGSECVDGIASMAYNSGMRVRRRKHIALHRGPAPLPTCPAERWSDTLAYSRPYRILTVVDHWSRSSPIVEAGFRMSGEIVSQILDRVLSEGPSPRSITVDHGTEFQSRALEDWAYRQGVQLDFIRPGKPVENAFIESFNGRLRDERRSSPALAGNW